MSKKTLHALLKCQQQVQSKNILEDDRRMTLNLSEINYQGVNGLREKLLKFIQESSQLDPNIIQQLMEQYSNYNQENFKLFTLNHILNLTDRRVEKMRKNKKVKKNWSPSDVNILIWITAHYAQLLKIPLRNIKDYTGVWQKISDLIPGTTPSSCMFRWLSLKKYKLTDHSWTQQQSNILANVVKQVGKKNWKLVSEYLYQLNIDPSKVYRQPKQCRQHWMSFLNPNLKKGIWSPKQDIMLLRWVYYNQGMRKWYKIAHMFQGRTQNAIKNRYHLIVYKSQRKRDLSPQTELQQVKIKLTELQKRYHNILDQIPQLPLLRQLSHLKFLKRKQSTVLNKSVQVKSEHEISSYQNINNTPVCPQLYDYSYLNGYNYSYANTTGIPFITYSWPKIPYFNYSLNGFTSI